MKIPMIWAAVVFPILVLVSDGVVSRTLAFNEPDGFRGVPWGAGEEELRAKGDVVHCYDYSAEKQWLGHRACSGGFLLGDIKVKAIYVFRSARFVRVMLTFKSDDFARIVRIFLERYDSPTDEATQRFKTQGGVESTNNILKWSGPVVAIELQRYGSRITEGYALIALQKELQESARLRQEQTKDAAKGL